RDLALEPHAGLRIAEGSTRTRSVVPANAGTHNHRLWNMGPQHKRVYARLRRAMRGDDNGVISGVRTAGRETSRRARARSAAVAGMGRGPAGSRGRRPAPAAAQCLAARRRTTARPKAPARLRPPRPDGQLS